MQILKVEGGHPLGGEVRISGNKNAALPMIAAALLTDEPIVLHNLPDILDVNAMLSVAELLGADVSFSDHTATIRASRIRTSRVPREWCSKMRTSILFAAPLVVRTGKAELFPPGGDVIGRRRLDGHFYGLETLGCQLECDELYSFTASERLKGRELFLDEASVTATEQILIAAATADGVTILRNAASEPHVTDLAELLNAMGAKISGLSSNTLTIEGVEKLHGTEFTVGGDHIEAGSFLSLAAATGAEMTILGTVPRHYWMLRRVFERLGFEMVLNPDSIYFPGGQQPEIKRDFGGHTPVISDGPWPQFPSDMMSCSIVAATQCRGSVMFFEKMFESRIYFVDRLIAMGADAIVCDPHRVVINGPVQLHGATLSSPDIRAGMALLIAALCAKGNSTIHSCEMIFRGYENIVEKLRNLGAVVTPSPF